MPRPAVFLDRDGVVNRAEVRDGVPQPPVRLEDFELLTGVVEAVQPAAPMPGFAVVIVTNQPDVARGEQRRAVVEAMNDCAASGARARRASWCAITTTLTACACQEARSRDAIGSGRRSDARPRRRASWSAIVGVTSRQDVEPVAEPSLSTGRTTNARPKPRMSSSPTSRRP